jgi:isoamyl acetate esterase
VKKLIILIPIILLSFTLLPTKKKIVFFGDSITQMGVNKDGYITLMDSIIKSQKLPTEYELIGAGIGGNKIYDLYLRMEEDVLSKKPDIVVIYVGINDIWHKSMFGTGTDLDKYIKFYKAIITKLQQNNIKVVMCTPTVIGERIDQSNPQDGELNLYSNAIRGMSQKDKITLIDLRIKFLIQIQKLNKPNVESGVLTTDRVHLNYYGNLFVADKMWEVLKTL